MAYYIVFWDSDLEKILFGKNLVFFLNIRTKQRFPLIRGYFAAADQNVHQSRKRTRKWNSKTADVVVFMYSTPGRSVEIEVPTAQDASTMRARLMA